MSDEDKIWLEKMLCKGTNISYIETQSIWSSGKQIPFEQTEFEFKCQMLTHADDRVKLYFHFQEIGNDKV